jgi:regulator of sigma E protease
MLSFLIFIVILSILIIAHEFGHFIVAKRSGVKAEKFAIGFGPPIVKVKGKETTFLICLFPLGGYVKLAGDSRSECKGYSYEFLSKPPGIKMRIVFAGPLFNYILAFILFWWIAVMGFPYLDTVVGKVLEGFPAQKAGLQENDRILEVNGKEVNSWQEMSTIIYKSKGEVSLKIERKGRIVFLNVPLQEKEIVDDFGVKKNVPIIGISASAKTKIVKYNIFEGFLKGWQALFQLTVIIIKGIVFMILGILPLREAVTGPLGIYYVTSEAVKVGLRAIIHLMAILNVSLTIVNLIPFPVLDGGHIFIFLIEKIRRKELSEKSEEFLTRLGFVVIALLIIFVFYSDIVRFGSKIWGG